MGVAYLDYSKAFDTVSHRILKEKQMKHGLNEQAMRWTENWLNEQPGPQGDGALNVWRRAERAWISEGETMHPQPAARQWISGVWKKTVQNETVATPQKYLIKTVSTFML